MSNIAGKAYAMNLLTPVKWYLAPVNKFFFWLVGTPIFKGKLRGLLTLSLIHYARWVIVKDSEFPRLSPDQPAEKLKYRYMFFFSNFNGSWAQYVDSFSAAIPSGLDLLWYRNVKWPKAVPQLPFHAYISFNQMPTSYYYSAYPIASSNDVKSAQKVKKELTKFVASSRDADPESFQKQYDRLLLSLQQDLGSMEPAPIVSLAAEAVQKRRALEE